MERWEKIEKIAINRGHEVVLRIDKGDTNFDLKIHRCAKILVSYGCRWNISMALNQNVPVISGTSWLDNFDTIKHFVKNKWCFYLCFKL